MNTKTILAYFLGVISCLLLCMLVYFKYGNNVEIKDVLPSLVTGIVTFAALLFTYLNNREQRDVQIKTTVQKEWIQKVREFTATIIYIAPIIAEKNKTRPIVLIDVDEKEDAIYKADLAQFLSSHSHLFILLNNTIPLQAALLQAVGSLYLQMELVRMSGNDDLIGAELGKTVTAAHNLISAMTD